MSMTMKRIIQLIAAACMLVSCDDGHVTENGQVYESDGYDVTLSGTFTGLDSWRGEYSVVVAGFGDDSDYSIIQKTIPSDGNGTDNVEVHLTNVSRECKTIEVAAVNNLRARLVTFYCIDVDEHRADDTIRIDCGEIHASMYDAINHGIFNDPFFSCARCHSSSRPTAGLDLSEANSLSNLVEVRAKSDSTATRVVRGDWANSYLYRVITDGAGIGYSHPALFSEDRHARLTDLVKEWIVSLSEK